MDHTNRPREGVEIELFARLTVARVRYEVLKASLPDGSGGELMGAQEDYRVALREFTDFINGDALNSIYQPLIRM